MVMENVIHLAEKKAEKIGAETVVSTSYREYVQEREDYAKANFYLYISKIQEWTDAVGTDGNLVNNTLSYIKFGNGIDSVDEIVKTESVKQKLVYATVTYTNKSDEEINHMLYIGTLLLMDHEDGSYQIYDPTEQSGDDYDRVIWDGVARTAEMTYNSISEDYGNGGNYISSLKPGESIQVNMAWIVNENDLNNMYLSLNGDGATYEFSDSMLKTGLVDIYQ